MTQKERMIEMFVTLFSMLDVHNNQKLAMGLKEKREIENRKGKQNRPRHLRF